MREILFRGKKVDNDEWVEGWIVRPTDYYGDKVARYFIIDGTETQDYDIGYEYEVISDTVSEYTGFTDKNDNKIFEGDIVQKSDGTIWSIEFHNGAFQAKSVKNKYTNIYEDIIFSNLYKIIGNIYDNPELLNK